MRNSINIGACVKPPEMNKPREVSSVCWMKGMSAVFFIWSCSFDASFMCGNGNLIGTPHWTLLMDANYWTDGSV